MLTGADQFFSSLRPARMGNFWIDIGDKIVFPRPVGIPKRLRSLGGEFDLDDLFAALKTACPRYDQVQRRAMLLGQRAAIDPRGDQQPLVELKLFKAG